MRGNLWRLPQLGLPAPGEDPESAGPSLGPALLTYFCPAMHRRPEGFVVPPPSFEGDQLDLFDSPAEPAGLVPPRNLSTVPEGSGRNGFRGLTAKGKRAIRDSCAILEAERLCLSFWTVSLPDDALAGLAASDGWARFVAELRRLLVRRMAAAGLPPHVVGVVELHPDRSRRESCPLPHLHVVYRSKRSRNRPWLMGKDAHVELIRQALAIVGVHPMGLQAASRVEQIKKSVARYVSKYISKTKEFRLEIDGDWLKNVLTFAEDLRCLVCLTETFRTVYRAALSLVARSLAPLTALIPRQWWFRSQSLADLVRSLTVVLPEGFCRWVVKHAGDHDWGGAVTTFYLSPADTGAPPIWRLAWESVDSLAWLLALWGQDCEDEAEQFRVSPLYGCSRPDHHPRPHQHP